MCSLQLSAQNTLYKSIYTRLHVQKGIPWWHKRKIYKILKTATYMYDLIILHPSTLVRQNTC